VRDGETPQTKVLGSSIIYSLSGDLNKSEQTNLAGELTAFDTGLHNWALTPTPPRQGHRFLERDVANNYFQLIYACVAKIRLSHVAITWRTQRNKSENVKRDMEVDNDQALRHKIAHQSLFRVDK
jgi:hypothetical protein